MRVWQPEVGEQICDVPRVPTRGAEATPAAATPRLRVRSGEDATGADLRRVSTQAPQGRVTWLRIDDCMIENPKIIGLTDGAFRLHMTALCYCARHLTDGFVAQSVAASWKREREINELISAKLWRKNARGYRIKDYLDYNPSKAEVEETRMKWRERASAGGKAKAAKRLLQADSKQVESSAPSRPLPPDRNINQEDSDDGATRALLEAMGEHERSQAHMELLAWRARGCSEFDFRSVARAVAKARPTRPRDYVNTAFRNRLGAA